MLNNGLNHNWKIGNWRIEPGLNRISNGEQDLRLEPKLMAVLVRLALAKGDIVTGEALVEQVWEGAHVTESIVRRAISELRRHLGDDARQPHIIETVPKRGYRLIVPAIQLPDPKGAEPQEEPKPAPKPHNRWWSAPLAVAALTIAALIWWPVDNRPLSNRLKNRPYLDIAMSPRYLALTHRQGMRVIDRFRNRDWITTIPARAPLWRNGQIAWLIEHETAMIGELRDRDIRVVHRFPLSGNTSGLAWYDDERLLVSQRINEAYRLTVVDIHGAQALIEPPFGFVGDREPALSRNQLAFVRETTPGRGDLYVANHQGHDIRRLTFLNTAIKDLAWHGTEWWFLERRDTGGRLMAVDPKTQKVRIVYERHDLSSWTAHADQVWGLAQELEHELFVRALDQERATRQISQKTLFRDTHLDESGNTTLISHDRGVPEIYELSVNAIVQRSSFGGAEISGPRRGPEGAVLCAAKYEDQWDVMIIEVSGGEAIRLTYDEADDLEPDWYPGGERFVFASNRDAGWQLYRMDRDGGVVERLTLKGGRHPRITRDWLYYTSPNGQNLWRMNAEGQTERFQALEPLSQWSVDEAWVIWSHQQQLFGRRHDDGSVRRFPDLPIHSKDLHLSNGRIIYRTGVLEKSSLIKIK